MIGIKWYKQVLRYHSVVVLSTTDWIEKWLLVMWSIMIPAMRPFFDISNQDSESAWLPPGKQSLVMILPILVCKKLAQNCNVYTGELTLKSHWGCDPAESSVLGPGRQSLRCGAVSGTTEAAKKCDGDLVGIVERRSPGIMVIPQMRTTYYHLVI